MDLDQMLHNYGVGSTQRVGIDFFARHSALVAWDLLGMYLVRYFPNNGGKHVVGQIREVAAYQGETQSSSEGILAAPGVISVSRKYNQHLLDIATSEEGKPACVTLRGAAFDFGGTIELKGPGVLTRALQIDAQFTGDNIASSSGLWVEGIILPSEMKKRRNLSTYTSNCLGYYYI